jgi:hypothetical protein
LAAASTILSNSLATNYANANAALHKKLFFSISGQNASTGQQQALAGCPGTTHRRKEDVSQAYSTGT